MNEIAKIILSAKRRRFLSSRPVFVRYTPVSESELFRIATGLNFKFALGLSKWLLLAGFGDIDETLSFREEWFSVIGEGRLAGYVLFARDIVGNQYAFNPEDGGIYYVHQPEHAFARISDDFPSFLKELIRRDYKLAEWMNTISISK